MPTPDTIAWAYPLAFWTHISLVIASVSLFTARGLGVLADLAWPMRPGWRGLSVWIDVGLLSAGGTLWYLLQFNPWQDRWLGAKLVLLVVYIGLGSMVLKRAWVFIDSSSRVPTPVGIDISPKVSSFTSSSSSKAPKS